MADRLVCLCNGVTEKDIIAALKKGGRSTLDIQKATHAGTNCGRCLVVVDSIVDEFLANLPNDPQQKIDFGF